jgi:magnesium transporter
MNFENMPELKTAHGYFAVLGLMLIVAVGLLIYFWRRGWIGNNEADRIPDDKED